MNFDKKNKFFNNNLIVCKSCKGIGTKKDIILFKMTQCDECFGQGLVFKPKKSLPVKKLV